jgi:hypothetical protein
VAGGLGETSPIGDAPDTLGATTVGPASEDHIDWLVGEVMLRGTLVTACSRSALFRLGLVVDLRNMVLSCVCFEAVSNFGP